MYRKIITKIGYSGVIVLILIMTHACQKKADTNINTAKPSILEYIAQNKSLSILQAAIKRVKLDTVMGSGGPFTFFAPNDSAFNAAGFTLDSINKMDPQKLLLILKYHVITGRVSSNDLAGMLKQQFVSLHPVLRPFISKNYYGIFFNGIMIVDPNHELGDGVVQVINAVSIPPAGSQMNIIERQPDLTFFAALVHQCYAVRLLVGDPNPYSQYSGRAVSGSYNGVPISYGNTIFAPTDSAFKAFGYADSTAVVQDSVALVYGGWVNNNYAVAILAPYFFNGFDFTCDFMGNYMIGGQGGTNSAPVQFRGSVVSLYTSIDGLSFNGNGISLRNPVKIIGPNLIATNGVVHKINQVFNLVY